MNLQLCSFSECFLPTLYPLSLFLQRETNYESPEISVSTWTPNQELRDSLVDMYKDNPQVNVELRQRLPSCTRQPSNPDKSVLPLSSQRKSPLLPLCHRGPRVGTPVMELDLVPSRGASPGAESRGASRGPSSPDLRRHVVTTDASSHQDVEFSRLQIFEQDKNVLFLLKEVDALRDVNKKLQEQLVQKERELQRQEVEKELRVEQREAQAWERPAVVLEEVLAAQKDRDQALMSRVLLANEERDEALLQARRLQQAANLENLNLESDLGVEELLQHICEANSVEEVEHCGLVLVQRVQLARQQRNYITAQEMKAVIKERDGSVAKCKRLEQDLVQDQEQQVTKEQLLVLQRERDGALEDKQRLEAELQALRINHRSLDHLTRPHTLSADGIAGSQISTSVAMPLQIQLQQLSKEKQNMETELQRCQEAEREARERVNRLERLVEVLRKKVGTGNLRAII